MKPLDLISAMVQSSSKNSLHVGVKLPVHTSELYARFTDASRGQLWAGHRAEEVRTAEVVVVALQAMSTWP